MPTDAYNLVEICHLNDPLLLPWLDLYEVSFPPAERIPVSRILNVLHNQARGRSHGEHLLAAVPTSLPNYRITDQRITALLFTLEPPGSLAAFLWYFAVDPQARGQGLGGQLYRDALARLEAQVRAMIFDVEDPEKMETPEEQDCARRRLGFYRRLGARVLGGIHYVQRVSEYQPPLDLRLMVHPVQEITPREAYDLAKEAMPEAVSLAGELRWE